MKSYLIMILDGEKSGATNIAFTSKDRALEFIVQNYIERGASPDLGILQINIVRDMNHLEKITIEDEPLMSFAISKWNKME